LQALQSPARRSFPKTTFSIVASSPVKAWGTSFYGKDEESISKGGFLNEFLTG